MTAQIIQFPVRHRQDDTPARPVLRRCPECGRQFDLSDEDDAAEWSYGHDCE